MPSASIAAARASSTRQSVTLAAISASSARRTPCACALAASVAGCGIKGPLETPQAKETASAESGQGKPEGAAAKPHWKDREDGGKKPAKPFAGAKPFKGKRDEKFAKPDGAPRKPKAKKPDRF